MEITEYIVSSETRVVITKEYNALVNKDEFRYHKISDVIEGVSHKPASL